MRQRRRLGLSGALALIVAGVLVSVLAYEGWTWPKVAALARDRPLTGLAAHLDRTRDVQTVRGIAWHGRWGLTHDEVADDTPGPCGPAGPFGRSPRLKSQARSEKSRTFCDVTELTLNCTVPTEFRGTICATDVA